MIIEDGVEYRNPQEQIQKNKDDIEALDPRVTSNTTDISNLKTSVEEIETTVGDIQSVDKIQSINLTLGDVAVTYDTTDGMQINATGRIITDKGNTDPQIDLAIPIKAGNGISIDRAADEDFVVIKSTGGGVDADAIIANTRAGNNITIAKDSGKATISVQNNPVFDGAVEMHSYYGSYTSIDGSNIYMYNSKGGNELSIFAYPDDVSEPISLNLPVKSGEILCSGNVKTLFGNQSIVGSGNIDLYRHVIKGVGGGCEWVTTFISSKNTAIDSLTDLYSALGDCETYPANGWFQQMSGGTVYAFEPKASGNILYASTSGGAATISWTNAGPWTITDTVTTV